MVRSSTQISVPQMEDWNRDELPGGRHPQQGRIAERILNFVVTE